MTKILSILAVTSLLTISCTTQKDTTISATSSEKTEVIKPAYIASFDPRKAIIQDGQNDTIPIDNLMITKGTDTVKIGDHLLANIGIPKSCTSNKITGKSSFQIKMKADQSFGEATIVNQADNCIEDIPSKIAKSLSGWTSTRGVGKDVNFIIYYTIEEK